MLPFPQERCILPVIPSTPCSLARSPLPSHLHLHRYDGLLRTDTDSPAFPSWHLFLPSIPPLLRLGYHRPRYPTRTGKGAHLPPWGCLAGGCLEAISESSDAPAHIITLTSQLLNRLLPADERGSNLVMSIVREIFVCSVLQPALANADPDNINYGINYLLSDPTVAGAEDAESAAESAPGQNVAAEATQSAALSQDAAPGETTSRLASNVADLDDALPVRPALHADFDGLRPTTEARVSTPAVPSGMADPGWRYFAGPISRADAEALLARAPLGAFLLRSKEGGTVVLSYVAAAASASVTHTAASSSESKESMPQQRSISFEGDTAATVALVPTRLTSVPAITSPPASGLTVRHTVVQFDGSYSLLQRTPASTLSAALRGVRETIWIGAVVKDLTAKQSAVSKGSAQQLSAATSSATSTLPSQGGLGEPASTDVWSRFSVRLESLYCDHDAPPRPRPAARPAAKFGGIFGTSKRSGDKAAGSAIAAAALGRLAYPSGQPGGVAAGGVRKHSGNKTLATSLSSLLSVAVARMNQQADGGDAAAPSTGGSGSALPAAAAAQRAPASSFASTAGGGADDAWGLDLDSDGEAELDEEAGRGDNAFSSEESDGSDGEEGEGGAESEDGADEADTTHGGSAASQSVGAGSPDGPKGTPSPQQAPLIAPAPAAAAPPPILPPLAPAPAAAAPRRKIFDDGGDLFGPDVAGDNGGVSNLETPAVAALGVDRSSRDPSIGSDDDSEAEAPSSASFSSSRRGHASSAAGAQDSRSGGGLGSAAVAPGPAPFSAAAAHSLRVAKEARRWRRNQVRQAGRACVQHCCPCHSALRRRRSGARLSSGRRWPASSASLTASRSSSTTRRQRGGRGGRCLRSRRSGAGRMHLRPRRRPASPRQQILRFQEGLAAPTLRLRRFHLMMGGRKAWIWRPLSTPLCSAMSAALTATAGPRHSPQRRRQRHRQNTQCWHVLLVLP